MKSIVLFAVFLMSFSAFAEKRKITLVNYETDGVKQWLPGSVIVKKGDEVELTLINNVPSGDHGFFLPDFKIREIVTKGKKKVVKFKADKTGLFPMECHMHQPHIGGQLLVIE
ncbi:MAG: cupredoxin domain-containing protein [Bacteriovoracia bacterium]